MAQKHLSMLDAALDVGRLGLATERRPARCDIVTPKVISIITKRSEKQSKKLLEVAQFLCMSNFHEAPE